MIRETIQSYYRRLWKEEIKVMPSGLEETNFHATNYEGQKKLQGTYNLIASLASLQIVRKQGLQCYKSNNWILSMV